MSNTAIAPGFFGLRHTNRDFTQKAYWDKNRFDNSFTVALACYMGCNNVEPVYLSLNEKNQVSHSYINVEDVFGLRQLSPNLFFAFETEYTTHLPLIFGSIPHTDLVTFDVERNPAQLLRALEIKLTALPDDTTCTLTEDKYGCEIVVRPDTIVYLALGVAELYRSERKTLQRLLHPVCRRVKDWEEVAQVKPLVGYMADALDEALLSKLDVQIPFLMQPVWKTFGTSNVLHDQCFDLFIWSGLAFTRLFIDVARRELRDSGVTRNVRSIVWLFKMLDEFAMDGRIYFQKIINRLTYNMKNDKAFATSGAVTNPFMRSPELTSPRIGKYAIKEIILGGGQKFLIPERHLDAAIINTPGLFN